jgi:hypothetical protein
MENDYTIEEHVHRYACWTAARAASTSRFSNAEVLQFITDSGLREALQALRLNVEINHSIYKDWYVEQVNILLKNMDEYKNSKDKKRKKLFGIAAKIVSIYIKTAEILPSLGDSKISKVAFPPIDRFLLSGLKKKLELKNISWSNMEKDEYMGLIETLKKFIGNEPFWKLEMYWDLNKITGD